MHLTDKIIKVLRLTLFEPNSPELSDLGFVYVFEYHRIHKPLTSGIFLINLINKGGVVSSKRRSLNSGLKALFEAKYSET